MADGEPRVSLGPLKPIEALKALLKVDPDSKPTKPDKGKGDDSGSKPGKNS